MDSPYITNWVSAIGGFSKRVSEKFDTAILDGWNPLYYGRYVDDILLVEKVEEEAESLKKRRMVNWNSMRPLNIIR